MVEINTHNWSKFLMKLDKKFGAEANELDVKFAMKELAVKFFLNLTDEDLGKNDDGINTGNEIHKYFQRLSIEVIRSKILGSKDFSNISDYTQWFEASETRMLFGRFLLYEYRDLYQDAKERALENMDQALSNLRGEKYEILF